MNEKTALTLHEETASLAGSKAGEGITGQIQSDLGSGGIKSQIVKGAIGIISGELISAGTEAIDDLANKEIDQKFSNTEDK